MPNFGFPDRAHTRWAHVGSLVVAVAALSGCGAIDTATLRDDPAKLRATWEVAGGPLDYLAAGAEKAIVSVRVECSGSKQEHGSAFVIRRNGKRAYLLTSLQLLHPPKERCQVQRISLQGAGIVPIEIDPRERSVDEGLNVHSRRDADIALLSVLAEPEGPTLQLAQPLPGAADATGTGAGTDPALYGKAALLTLGYVAGAPGSPPTIKVSQGALSAAPPDAAGRLHADGPVEPWSVGGPALLTATGQVVGMITYGSDQASGGERHYLLTPASVLGKELREQADLDLATLVAPYGLNRLPHGVVARPEETSINQQLQRRGPAPFVLLTGGPDVGKSAVANKLGWDHVFSGQFPGGIVRLQVYDRATDDLLGELHTAVLHRPPPQQLGETVATLVGALKGRRILVILDDVRWEGERLPNELLQALGDTAVLATSRRKYTDSRVQTVEIGSLSRDLARRQMRNALTESAGRILTDSDVDLIAERLGLNPLAMNLAVEVLNRTEVAAEPFLDHLQAQRLRAIDDGEMSGPLAAVLELTWDGLGGTERNVVTTMGLLAEAPAPPELLAAMLGESVSTVETALAHLAGQAVLDSPAQGRNFSMHPLVHAWAKEKADQSWFRGWKRDRLISWYLKRAEAQPARTWTPALSAQLQTAQEWAARDGKVKSVYDLAQAWHDRLRELGPWSLWDRMWRNAVESALRSDDLKTLMLSLRQLAWTRELAGYGTGAEPLYRDSLLLARDLRDQRAIVEVLNELGTRVGSSKQAVELLKESQMQAQILGDQRLVATTLQLLSWAYEAMGDFESAEKCLQQSLTIYQNLQAAGPQPGQPSSSDNATVNTLRNLYALSLRRKDAAAAQSWLVRSIDACGAERESECAVPSYLHLGRLADQRGDEAEAKRHFDHALAIVRKLPDTGYLAQVLDELAHREERKGDMATAMTLWRQARDSATTAGDLRRKVNVAIDGAALAYRLRDFSLLQEQLDIALDLYARLGDRRGYQTSIVAFDYLRWSGEELSQQLTKLQDAQHQAALAQSEAVVVRTEVAQARIWRLRGERERAEPLLLRATQYYERRRDAHGQALVTSEYAAIAAISGENRAARTGFNKALLLCEKVAAAERLSCLHSVASDAQETRQWVPAQHGFERRLALLRTQNKPMEVASATEDLADLAMARGDRPNALKRYQESLALWTKVKADLAVVRQLERQAHLSWERGEWLGADQWLQEAVALSAHGEQRNETFGRIRLLQAQLAYRQRQRSQARTYVTQAIEIFEHLKVQHGELEAASTLLRTIDAGGKPPERRSGRNR